MEFVVRKGKASEFETEALAVLLYEEDKQLPAGLQPLDEKMHGLLREIMDAGDFEGKANQIAVIYTRGAIPAKRLVLTGLGKRADLDREKLRGAFAKAAQQVRSLNVKKFALDLELGGFPLAAAEAVEAIAEGVYLGLYQFTPFKTLERDKFKELKEFTFLGEGEEAVSEIKKAVKTAATICHAVCFARDLVSTPGNEMTPSDLAREAQAIAAARKKVHLRILEAGEMKELGMNALLGVAGGSCQPPKFIILEYRGGRRGKAPVALVGKGLTFDSGGISLKPAEKMDGMKTDQGGGGGPGAPPGPPRPGPCRSML